MDRDFGFERRSVARAFALAVAAASAVLWAFPRHEAPGDAIRTYAIGGALLVLAVGWLVTSVDPSRASWLGGVLGLGVAGAELGFGAGEAGRAINFNPAAAMGGAVGLAILGLLILGPLVAYRSEPRPHGEPDYPIEPDAPGLYHEDPNDPRPNPVLSQRGFSVSRLGPVFLGPGRGGALGPVLTFLLIASVLAAALWVASIRA